MNEKWVGYIVRVFLPYWDFFFLTFLCEFSKLSKSNSIGPSFGRGWLPFPLFFPFLLLSLLLLLLPPVLFPNLFCVSYLAGMPRSSSSLVQFLAMHPVEIACRAPVFPTPPLSCCYLPFLAVLFVGFHGLHLDSWLLCLSCWLSLLRGCARGEDQNWMVHLMRCCLVVGEDRSISEIFAAVEVVELSSCYCCALPFGANLLFGPFVICLFWPFMFAYKLVLGPWVVFVCIAFQCLIKSLLTKKKKTMSTISTMSIIIIFCQKN